MKFFNLCISVLISLLFVFSISAYAKPLGDIRVIKISPQDGRAIIKTTERKLRIIKVGDKITVQSSENKKESSEFEVQSSEYRVMEIADGRVVFEEMTDEGFETVIIRLENGKQRIERIRKTADKEPLMYVPRSVEREESEEGENGERRSGMY